MVIYILCECLQIYAIACTIVVEAPRFAHQGGSETPRSALQVGHPRTSATCGRHPPCQMTHVIRVMYLILILIQSPLSHRLGWNRVEWLKLTGKYSEPSGHLESLLFLADYS